MFVAAGLILLFVFVFSILRLYYHFAVIPVLRDKAKFELYAVRDELRSLAISGAIDSTSFSFMYFEQVLNGMIRLCTSHSVSKLLYFLLAERENVPRERIEERERFVAESSESFRALEKRCMETMLRIMFANSPLFCVLAFLLNLVNGAVRRTIELKNAFMLHCADNSLIRRNGTPFFPNVAHR